jgi:hypothetical protein
VKTTRFPKITPANNNKKATKREAPTIRPLLGAEATTVETTQERTSTNITSTSTSNSTKKENSSSTTLNTGPMVKKRIKKVDSIRCISSLEEEESRITEGGLIKITDKEEANTLQRLLSNKLLKVEELL